MARILYVEDDETLSYITKDHLELKGYEVVHFAKGKEALEAFKEHEFDLCILDVMLPEMDGFALAREIRKRDVQVPILFLTAKSLKEDRIEGLQLGADDYITKPFSMEELLLRIQVFLRRRNITDLSGEAIYTLGKFRFDYDNLTLTANGEDHTLTQREADLLKLFAEHPRRVLKRSDILLQIWGEDDYFLGRSLDVFVSRLRKYLKSDDKVTIENVHGVGFRFKV
ncbi:MAG: response regulator transcription factor [Saprospiraceae bacterium]|nr:response regulator transcription factor [Saprospiraceae bacterium]